jgi:hypothetical protein
MASVVKQHTASRQGMSLLGAKFGHSLAQGWQFARKNAQACPTDSRPICCCVRMDDSWGTGVRAVRLFHTNSFSFFCNQDGCVLQLPDRRSINNHCSWKIFGCLVCTTIALVGGSPNFRQNTKYITHFSAR